MSRATRMVIVALASALGGCRDIQSALSPANADAERITLLAWILFIGAAAIFALVFIIAALSVAAPRGVRRFLASDALVWSGGLVFPIVVLSALLAYGLHLTASGASRTGEGEALRIEVRGERWWWRVFYRTADGRTFETANEIVIPAGQRVALTLTSADVIHSFWVPRLAGKLDMIPGRATTLTISAAAPGLFRGQCAEYCGGPHALMSMHVVAVPEAEFSQWLQWASIDARAPASAEANVGQRLFLAKGCGGCHRVRGTPANGEIGPDLTHVGSRQWIAAATLRATPATFARWIRDNQAIKPENLMLPYPSLTPAETHAIALYLTGLD